MFLYNVSISVYTLQGQVQAKPVRLRCMSSVAVRQRHLVQDEGNVNC